MAKAAGKGQNFERLICRQLSLWVSHGRHDDLFWRTAMSGGRATLRHAKGLSTQTVGDICAVDPKGFPFTDRYLTECKHHRDLDLHGFMFGKGKLFKFWVEETLHEAFKYERIPLLIAKQNNMPTILITNNHEFSASISTVVVKTKQYGAVAAVIHYFDDVLKTKFVP